MASPANAVLCALIATAFWTFLGYGVARQLLPRALATRRRIGHRLGGAHRRSLPIVAGSDFLPIAVGIGALCIAHRRLFVFAARAGERAEPACSTVPPWAFAAAAILALVPAAAILPKFSGDAVHTCGSDFRSRKDRDHRRDGPARPAAGQSHLRRTRRADRLALLLSLAFQRGRGRAGPRRQRLGSRYRTDLVYRFRLAQPDDGACGLASQAIRRRDLGAGVCRRGLVVGHTLLAFHADDLMPVLWPPIGMAGWLFQATWVPQHLMAASCVVTAMLLVAHYAQRQSAGSFSDACLGHCCRV